MPLQPKNESDPDAVVNVVNWTTLHQPSAMSTSVALNWAPASTAAFVTVPGDKMFKTLSSNSGSVTLMTWVKTSGYLTGVTNEIDLLGASFTVKNATISLFLKIVNGNYVFGTFPGSPSDSASGPPSIVPPQYVNISAPIIDGDDGNWVHLCGQFDSDKKNWSLYRNSFLMASTTGPGYTPTNVSWYLGGSFNGPSLNCSLEMRAVWVLGSAVLQKSLQNYYLPIYGTLPSTPPSTDNLIAYWPLNEGTGQAINDLSRIGTAANGSFDAASVAWALDFNLGLIGFVDPGGDLVTIVNQQSSACTFFIAPGTYSSTGVTLELSSKNLVGFGPDNTLITIINPPIHSSVFSTCGINCYRTGGCSQLDVTVVLDPQLRVGFALIYSQGLNMSYVNLTGKFSYKNASAIFSCVEATDVQSGSGGVNASNCKFIAQVASPPASGSSKCLRLSACSSIFKNCTISCNDNGVGVVLTDSSATPYTSTFDNCVITAIDPCPFSLYGGSSNSVIICNQCTITGPWTGYVTVNNVRVGMPTVEDLNLHLRWRIRS